ncbi:hypothetical protein [Novosphingobium sp.]|uniref:hypothetical protein n=1 Tax=Novosphingobium sp. TaxID=1874826 RepID=UPI0027355005|nr:hypothetical protein [Novosphingobium sp.]MDP3908622.1 hypothetical protein [Novosphingobium sp.]
MARFNMLVLSGLLAAASAAPALATDPAAPSARLVECGSESCLLISGRRADTTASISINGHVVAAEGARRWRVRVPVETVRAWSVPYARTLTVSVAGVSRDARLPIGLLGKAENLAMVIVRVK